MATQSALASTNFATGQSSLNFYRQDTGAVPQVSDLRISNLPANATEKEVRKISGGKHIIACVVDYDNMSG